MNNIMTVGKLKEYENMFSQHAHNISRMYTDENDNLVLVTSNTPVMWLSKEKNSQVDIMSRLKTMRVNDDTLVVSHSEMEDTSPNKKKSPVTDFIVDSDEDFNGDHYTAIVTIVSAA